MKSNEITIWMIVKHLFKIHTYGKWKTWRNPELGPNPPPAIYRNCEVCGKEYIAKYGIDFGWM